MHPALEGIPPGNFVTPEIPGVTHVLKYAIIDHAVSGANTIVAAVPGKCLRVINVVLIAAGTATARWTSIGQTTTNLTGDMALVANVGFAPGEAPLGHFQTKPNEILNLQLSAGVSVDGWLTYIEVDPS